MSNTFWQQAKSPDIFWPPFVYNLLAVFFSENLSDASNKKQKVLIKQQTAVTENQKWLYRQTRNLHSNPLHNLDVKTDLSTGPVTGEGLVGELKVEADDAVDCTENMETEVVSTYQKDKFDRRWLMLNSAQMHLENIPVPSCNQNSR